MIFCDLCGESKECLQKEIDGAEYDICADCWHPLADKLKGRPWQEELGDGVSSAGLCAGT
jgi:ribosome-binding protein aMBF1 (putative translation factor)